MIINVIKDRRILHLFDQAEVAFVLVKYQRLHGA